jgi:hypothetical protein
MVLATSFIAEDVIYPGVTNWREIARWNSPTIRSEYARHKAWRARQLLARSARWMKGSSRCRLAARKRGAITRLIHASLGWREQTMGKVLTDRQIQEFHRNGCVFPIPALGAADVARIRQRLGGVARTVGAESGLTYLGLGHLFFDWVHDLTVHSAILDALEDVMGPDILVHSTVMFAKNPREPGFVTWHQDGARMIFDEANAVSVFVAVTDVTAENGCMRLIPGSHRHGRLPYEETDSPNNLLARGGSASSDDRGRRCGRGHTEGRRDFPAPHTFGPFLTCQRLGHDPDGLHHSLRSSAHQVVPGAPGYSGPRGHYPPREPRVTTASGAAQRSPSSNGRYQTISASSTRSPSTRPPPGCSARLVPSE